MKKTRQEKEEIAERLFKQIEKLDNKIVVIGLEYFILKAIDDALELEILDNTITALLKE